MSRAETDSGKMPEHVIPCQPRYGYAKKLCEAHTVRGDATAAPRDEHDPAIQECNELTVRFAQVDVLAARFREHRSQLGEGKARQQRNACSGYPHQEEQNRRRQLRSNILRGQEDSATDHAAYDQQHRVGQRHHPQQRALLLRTSASLAIGAGYCSLMHRQTAFIGRNKEDKVTGA